jgi:hypothetical protein
MTETQPTGLLAALGRQAAADPEAPFLFWPEGWHWRWWSWCQVAELATRWSAPLAGLPPAAGAGFAGDAFPQAIPLDLAIQAAGLTPVPMDLQTACGGAADSGGRGDDGGPETAASHGAVAGPGCRSGDPAGWAAVPPVELVVRLEGERPEALEPRLTWVAAGKAPPAAAEAGVAVADESGRWRRLSQAELMAAAARVESAVGAPPEPRRRSRRREILVAGWPLQEWPARLLAAWATTSGAALVLDTDPGRRPGTVLWARPTVFYGSAAELVLLRRQVEAARTPRRFGRSRPPALPLGRLRNLFQAGPPEPAQAAFWQERGARLLQLPALPPALPEAGASRGGR